MCLLPFQPRHQAVAASALGAAVEIEAGIAAETAPGIEIAVAARVQELAIALAHAILTAAATKLIDELPRVVCIV